jgi:glucose-6-phosphate 1-dehydrogenase
MMILGKILDQGAEAHEVSKYIKDYLRENRIYILDYFMRLKELVNAEELRFY